MPDSRLARTRLAYPYLDHCEHLWRHYIGDKCLKCGYEPPEAEWRAMEAATEADMPPSDPDGDRLRREMAMLLPWMRVEA